jgi:putative membrane protein
MGFEYVKALHLIFIVTWFAGLFYIVRLFIYQTEALEKPEQERLILKPQLDLMARRLWYIITWPSAVLTLIFGFWVLTYRWGYLQQEFMQVKLIFVLLLYVYHGYSPMAIYLAIPSEKWSTKAVGLTMQVGCI